MRSPVSGGPVVGEASGQRRAGKAGRQAGRQAEDRKPCATQLPPASPPGLAPATVILWSLPEPFIRRWALMAAAASTLSALTPSSPSAASGLREGRPSSLARLLATLGRALAMLRSVSKVACSAL
jgi:hypothetical protein